MPVYNALADWQTDGDFAGEGMDVEKGEHQFADEKRRQIGENPPSRDGEKDERQGEKHGNRMVDEDGSRFPKSV